jgi:uncharacterized membrane protein
MPDLSQLSILEPRAPVLKIAHLVYALHTFAIVVGVGGAASVIGSFLGSVPSIVAVILNYLNRHSARGTWLESHYRWQIRTFWFALLWLLIAVLLIVTLIGMPVGFGILIAVTLWLIYRIARGWLRLSDRAPMYS